MADLTIQYIRELRDEARETNKLLRQLIHLVSDHVDPGDDKCPKCGNTDLKDASTMGNPGRMVCGGDHGCGAVLKKE